MVFLIFEGMIFRVVLLALIFFFIARFVMRYLLPILRVTRVARDRMQEMQERMESMQQNEQKRSEQKRNTIDGEYIDYEEVK